MSNLEEIDQGLSDVIDDHPEFSDTFIGDFLNKIKNYRSLSNELKFKVPTPADASSLVPDKLSFKVFLSKNGKFVLPDITSIVKPLRYQTQN